MRSPFGLTFAAILLLAAASSAFAAQPIELAAGTAPHHPQQPQVAVDPSGHIHVVFGIGDQIRYCRSTDGGRSFSRPAAVATVSNMALGMRRGPRIAAGEGFISITAIGGKQGKGRDGDVLAFRSTDGGLTWQGPTAVNDVPAAAREGLHSMAVGPKGELYCVWLDLRDNDSKVFMARSQDRGQTWNKNRLVYESPDGHVCECCHPTVVVDSVGGLAVMWRNWLNGARDMYLTTSPDGGETFSKAWKIGQGSWQLKACPMDGGSYANLFATAHATVWRRDDSVFLAQSGVDEERLLGRGEQPWIAAANGAYYIVWLKKRGETLYLLRRDDDSRHPELKPVELAPQAADPMVAGSLSGKGPAVAVWEANEGGRRSIRCQVVSD